MLLKVIESKILWGILGGVFLLLFSYLGFIGLKPAEKIIREELPMKTLTYNLGVSPLLFA